MINSQLFGLEERALKLCEDRAAVIANNIANASTPNFKARDLDFHQAIQGAMSQTDHLQVTHQDHLTARQSTGSDRLFYRIPMQTSFDGNTVDDDIERKNFVENSINYQANLGFAENKMRELIKAIKGE